MRSIKKIHQAAYRPINDLVTYSPIPNASLAHIDPFIFLNHHGPQTYPPNNNGLPFGPHPHRGMETVTIILEGDIAHKDSAGSESIINAGGVQWMTAGSGLIHAETSSEYFKQNGGSLEILQLWLNLPAKLKMTKPWYKGLQKDKIPHINTIKNNVHINLISGSYNGIQGAFNPFSDIFLSTIDFEKNSVLNLRISKERNIFLYVIRGQLNVNTKIVDKLHLIEFNNDNDKVKIEANEKSLLLLGHAIPIDEPIVARGPFVMNSLEEIQTAYEDYKAGKMGHWS